MESTRNTHVSMTFLDKYFPGFNPDQKEKILRLEMLVREWNEKINVISRKDIDQVFVHHILHSLALYKLVRLPGGINILDVGTGGGFPGIPLAIAFPEIRFKLIDGRNKKILVAGELIKALGLTNATAVVARSEELKEKFDIVFGRAVTSFPDFLRMTENNLDDVVFPESGVYYWTGGQPSGFRMPGTQIYKIEKIFEEDYFRNKFILHRKNSQFPR